MEIKLVLSATPELEALLTRIAEAISNPGASADAPADDKPRRGRKPKAEQVVAEATAVAAEASTEVAAAVATQAAAAAAPVTVAAPAPVAAATPTPAADPAGATGGMVYETDVRPQIIAALGNPEIGQARVLPVIQSFGVSNAKDIPPSRWPELLQKIAALSAPAFA